MRRTAAEKLAAQQPSKPVQQVKGDLRTLAERIVGGPMNPTQEDFIFCSDRRAWFVGPLGAAKTTSLIASVLVPAYLYPGSRWFIGRKTFWTLEETTLKKFIQALDRLGPNAILDRKAGPPFILTIAPAIQGAPPSELVFYGLDDVDKLGSMEFTGAAIDEANEVDGEIVQTLDERLRHKLPGQKSADGPFFLRLVSNPPARSHWLHRRFCRELDCDPVPWGRKFKPHKNENTKNLPKGYYETISAGMSPQRKARMIEGECGADVHGQAVFPEFDVRMHVGDLKYQSHTAMIRGWDFGRRRPACVWAQLLPNGHLNRLACALGDNVSLQRFMEQVGNRSSMQFPGVPQWIDFVDPHGVQRRDVTEETSISIMRKAGLNPLWKDVNVETGLELVSKGLSTLVLGRPRSMFDRVNCNLLVEGYSSGYVYPERQDIAKSQQPVKDGYYEHLMDADRYIEVGLSSGLVFKSGQRRLPTNLSKRTRPEPNGDDVLAWMKH